MDNICVKVNHHYLNNLVKAKIQILKKYLVAKQF